MNYLFAQLLMSVYMEIERKANKAQREIKAMCERDRRSLGQKFRWMK